MKERVREVGEVIMLTCVRDLSETAVFRVHSCVDRVGW